MCSFRSKSTYISVTFYKLHLLSFNLSKSFKKKIFLKKNISSCKLLSPLSPPHSPLAIVTLFLISMSLVMFCLLFSFVDYVPVKGEIIWYLSLTAWLISLSIMFSSSIHAVAKGISSFFLSAV